MAIGDGTPTGSSTSSVPFPFYAVITKEPASPPLHEHPASSRIRSPYQVGDFIFFLQSLCISPASSFSSLKFLFPIQHFASLSCCHSIYLFKNPPLFPHWHFHSFIVFHLSLSFFLQVYYGVISTHTYFCPSRLRSLWGCVGLTVPALPPSAGHPFPTPHMHLVSTYSLYSIIFHLSCLVCA